MNVINMNDLEKLALNFNNVLKVPVFEESIEDIEKNTAAIIKEATIQMDIIGKLDDSEVNFATTLIAMDDISYFVGNLASRLSTMMNTSTDEKIRQMCETQLLVLEKWSITSQYREDVYSSIKTLERLKLDLSGEDKRLYDDTIKHYKRLGMHLSKDRRKKVEELKNKLSLLSIDFSRNIREDKTTITFDESELKGLSDEILSELVKDKDGKYSIDPKISAFVDKVMENAEKESTRKKLYVNKLRVAKDKNVKVLGEIVKLRIELSKLLGFESWADYKIDINMAEKKDVVEKFLLDLKDNLDVKFKEELAIFTGMKVADLGKDVKLMPWDLSYYKRKLIKEKYDIDINELRSYFPYEAVLTGMFKVMGTVFNISISKVEPPYKWVEGLELYVVQDKESREPLGLFYLDMFPRTGKYTHFAQFGLIEGKTMVNGENLRPVVALICNFDIPTKDKPSLLTYRQVETLFHEFGHVLHNMLSKTKYTSNFGTNVPIDFVEVPSQLLENWLESKEVLDIFAAHYKDKSKKIPKNIIDKLKAIQNINVATFYRAQISYGLVDMGLHSKTTYDYNFDIVSYTNDILNRVYIPHEEDTAFISTFGHLVGYDAGYYGYAWADVISKDFASMFEKSKDGYLDKKIGLRLRKEIYEQGEKRDIKESIKAFLGREYSMEAFMKSMRK